MHWSQIARFIVAMLVMMNPLGSLSLFLGLTPRASIIERRRIAVTCNAAMTIILLVTIWIGPQLLSMLGITINSFRFAGGIILFLMGLSMLQSQDNRMNHPEIDNDGSQTSIAIVPLALPIIIGPGTISTLIIATNDYPEWLSKIYFSIISCVLALLMGGLLYYANTVVRIVGKAGINVITRIMGMILTAIAAGMLADGLQGLIPALNSKCIS